MPTPWLPPSPLTPYAVLSAGLWLLLAGLLWLWLRKELTPKRFLSIWESDGVLSTRLLGATALLVWAMSMYSAGRMQGADLESVLQWVGVFFAVGGAVKAAGALQPNTTVNAKQVSNLNIEPKPDQPTNPPANASPE